MYYHLFRNSRPGHWLVSLVVVMFIVYCYVCTGMTRGLEGVLMDCV